jgi:hypothetical protein
MSLTENNYEKFKQDVQMWIEGGVLYKYTKNPVYIQVYLCI